MWEKDFPFIRNGGKVVDATGLPVIVQVAHF